MKSQTILVHCPDQKGLIHSITGVLLRAGLNIVCQDEFVDTDAEQFFMRTEVSGDFNRAEVCFGLERVLPAGASIFCPARAPKKLVVLASSEPHCLGDLLVEDAFDGLPADVLAVVSNSEVLGDLVARFDIPFHFISCKGKERAVHEGEILAAVSQYEPDYLVLAKYMRIFTSGFVSHYENRIVNIHHSFLPAFVGANPYHQAFERGVKIIGATAHFVTDGLDEGPIIFQDVINVDHRKSPEDMVQAGRNVEKVVLNRALQLVCEDRVFVHGRRTVIFG